MSTIVQRLCRQSISALSYHQQKNSTFGSRKSLSNMAFLSDYRNPSNLTFKPPVGSRRKFSVTPISSHGHWESPKAGEEIFVTFVDKDGNEHRIGASHGDNLLAVAQGNDIEMEGACGGSCSCSTCHVIVEDEAMFNKIPEATDDENDMLDLAFGLTETSRLGCQIELNKELDGLRVKLPSMTRNLQASDFNAK